MKKLFILCFILLLLNAKSYSQTQFPFYGFELSNYEVGDTLEYIEYYISLPTLHDNYDTDVYRVINKEFIGVDTIKYTIEDTYFYRLMDGLNIENGRDTVQSIITNDTAYNNSNNILGLSFKGCGFQFNPHYVKYDTIKGLKNLKIVNNDVSYKLIQNIGVISDSEQDCGNPVTFITLMYAHLTHYGIYGAFKSIILATKNPSYQSASVYVRYNNGSSSLLISSTQNLPSLKLSIYDLLGRGLITMPVNMGNNPINFNNYPKGMYLYRVTSNGNIVGQGKVMNL